MSSTQSAFDLFRVVGQLSGLRTRHEDYATEWFRRRESLLLQLNDVSLLAKHIPSIVKHPNPYTPELKLFDGTPHLRLANAVEATGAGVYGLGEVVALLANRLDQAFPTGFNKLRKKLLKGSLDEQAKTALGDISWYSKIREMRTEWAHYSTVFIAGSDEEPLIASKSFRRKDDRVEFPQQTLCSLREFQKWTVDAVASFDNFGDYLARRYILPCIDLDAEFISVHRDPLGWPIFRDGLVSVKRTTFREHLVEMGVLKLIE